MLLGGNYPGSYFFGFGAPDSDLPIGVYRSTRTVQFMMTSTGVRQFIYASTVTASVRP